MLGIAAGATVPEWSRFIHDDANSCFTIDTVTIPGAVASRGPMCLINGGNVAVNSTGAATTVGVGTNLTVEAPDVASARAHRSNGHQHRLDERNDDVPRDDRYELHDRTPSRRTV